MNEMNEIICGIDVGGTFIKAGAVRDGKILAQSSLPTPHSSEKDIMQSLIDIIKDFQIYKIEAVGIGFAGLVNSKKGIVYSSPNFPEIHNFNVVRKLKQKLNLPVFIHNDASLYTLGEAIFGAGKGKKYILGLTLGTGVGGGIIINKKIYGGINGFAGEIGHTTIDINGEKCGCGNTGCLEKYVAANAIINRAKKEIKEQNSKLRDIKEITPEIISHFANKGDRVAVKVIKETGKLLGVGIASLINVLNPEIVIIGGGIANAGETLFESIRKEVHKRSYLTKINKVEIVPAQLGSGAGILGAYQFVLEKMFKLELGIHNSQD